MSETRVASRYAKSILELAQEKGLLEEVYQDMLLFTKTVTASRELGHTLRNPIVKHDKKQAILHAIFKGKVQTMTINLFDILTRKNREAILPDLAQEFVKQYDLAKGIQKAQVTTAVPLSNSLREEVTKLVVKYTGKKAELDEKIDPTILGGFILKVGDRQLDDSLRNSLRKLRITFNENPYIAKI